MNDSPSVMTRLRIGTLPAQALRYLRSIPFTLGTILVMLVVGTITGSLFSESSFERLNPEWGYGLPALQVGHWYTAFTGAFVIPSPELYIVMTVLTLLALGFYERKVGGWRSLLALMGTHVLAVYLTIALVGFGSWAGWPWAQWAATQRDMGLSAGMIGVLGALTAFLTPRFRTQVRWIVSVYLALMLVRSGLLWDPEHMFGWLAGVLAGPLLAGRERQRRPRPWPVLTWLRTGVASLMVLTVVTSAVLTIYPGPGGLFGRGHNPLDVQPLRVLASMLLLLAVGIVAHALHNGRPFAWWAAVGMSILMLSRAAFIPFQRSSADLFCWVVILTLLVVFRSFWPWRLPRSTFIRHVPRIGIVMALFVGLWLLLIRLFRRSIPVESRPVRWRTVTDLLTFKQQHLAMGRGLPRILFEVTRVGWIIAAIVVLIPLLYAASGQRRHEASARARLGFLLARYGGGSLGWMRTWPGFTTWLTEDGRCAVSHRVVYGVAIALGDPVGPEDEKCAAALEFRRYALRSGWVPCFFAASGEIAKELAKAHAGIRWRAVSVGQDAVLKLPGLAFTGKKWQDVRTARNHAAKQGIRPFEVNWHDASPQLLEQIHSVSTAWAGSKALPAMGFTLGTPDLAKDGVMRTIVAIDDDEVVHGVTTWMPIQQDGQTIGWTLDVMRRKPEGFRPVMEFLIAECAMLFASEGCTVMSLSVAPLAQPNREGPVVGVDRLLARLSDVLEPAYGFKSLLAFKAKFMPEFSPVYLIYCDDWDLPDIGVGISKAYLPKMSIGQTLSIARTLTSKRG